MFDFGLLLSSLAHGVYYFVDCTWQVIRMVGESQEQLVGAGGGGASGSNKTPTLEEYGTNLTNQANEVINEM